HFSFSAYISSSTSAYFFLPTVRLPTMFPRAVPTAPTSADAPPPPGTGALEASTSTNSLQGTVENPIIHILLHQFVIGQRRISSLCSVKHPLSSAYRWKYHLPPPDPPPERKAGNCRKTKSGPTVKILHLPPRE